MSVRMSDRKKIELIYNKFDIFKNYAKLFELVNISGRGVTVAYMLWEHAVRVQIPAPRQS